MMRLLKQLSDGSFELRSFDGDSLPPYAILSHTWTNGQEVTYDELLAGAGKDKSGYAKMRFCSNQAAADGLQYFWVDSCCIDKSNSVELSTALNSMFRWYQRASKCYVYLSDVSVPKDTVDAAASQSTWEEAFRQSRWFTRGWTLQELLAPTVVEFFSEERKFLGTRLSLEHEIHQITKLPMSVLRGKSLSDFSVDERMGWSDGRTTTIEEDRVYCLLGIFGVFLSLIYGEGEEYAKLRLREEIQKRKEGRGVQTLQNLAISSSLPFPRNELFTGREDQLKSLERYFFNFNSHRRMTVYGLGGCGKSSLSLEFAYRALARQSIDMVFWVPALSRKTFLLAYRDIGVRLRIPGIDDNKQDAGKLVRDMLNSGDLGSWLIIVDNADDAGILLENREEDSMSAALIDYLPHSEKGSVLFTTRSRKAARDLTQSSVLALHDMSKAEARPLLARRITNQALLDDETAVEKLLEILTYLPLAIVQAAAFINNNDLSVSEYTSLFQHAGTETELFGEHFEDPSRYREMDSTIAKTWHISFDQLRKKDPLAAEYLSFMACVDRINIPRSLLPPGESSVQQVKALGTLTGYAFITERQASAQNSDKEKFFDMHRLVHLTSGWWLDRQDQRTTWTEKAFSRLVELVPNGGQKNKEVWTAYLPHALHVTEPQNKAQEADKIKLLRRVGKCQDSLGQFAAAEATFKQVLSLSEKLFSSDDPDLLRSMTDYAAILNMQGRPLEAEKVCSKVVAKKEDLRKPMDLDLEIDVFRCLGESLDRQGKLKEAETIFQDIVAYQEKKRPGNPRLDILDDLGHILTRRGRYEEAEAILRETYAAREKQFKEGVSQDRPSLNIIALNLESQNRYEEAENLHRQELAARTEFFGPRHPETLVSMNNLAVSLSGQGKDAESEAIHRQEIAICSDVLGAEHPDTLQGIHNLGYIIAKQGRHAEAETWYNKALSSQERVLGPEHYETLDSVLTLASSLHSLGRYEESRNLFERACRSFRKNFDDDEPHVTSSHYQYRQMLIDWTDASGETQQASEDIDFNRILGRISDASDKSSNRSALTQPAEPLDVYADTNPNEESSRNASLRLNALLHPGVDANLSKTPNLRTISQPEDSSATAASMQPDETPGSPFGTQPGKTTDRDESVQLKKQSKFSRRLAKMGISRSKFWNKE